MIVGWIKNLFGSILPDSIGQGAQAFEKKAKARLIDVTDGISLTEEARKRNSELMSIVRQGGVQLDQLRFWLNSRRKTKKGIADFYDLPEIMDEITEKIQEAGKEDPVFRKLFG